MTSPRQRKKRAAFKRLQEKRLAEQEKLSSETVTIKEVSVEPVAIEKNITAVKTLKAKKEAKNALVELADKKVESTVESTDQTVKSES